LAWLPENGGLLITASKIPNKHYRIWQISVEKGNIEPLTNDSESYSRLSLDKEAKILISTQFKQDFRLSVLSIENPSNQRALADASRVTFAPDGKIYFASIMSGNDEIWSTNPDGSGQRQLTNDAADDTFPLVSGDNKFIYFASNRTGAMQLWRMNTDGSNQMQITEKEGGLPLFISPDARWIYYLHGLNRNLWRVSVKGGAEELILNQRAANFAFSPDGLQVAFLKENTIEVVSPVDKKTVRTFHLADQKPGFDDVAWMPDGKGIAFISTETDENYYLRLQPTDGGTPQTIAALGNEVINSFAAAPDGRSFAVVKGGWRHDAVLLKGLK
jgi:Tol biopolymer transport system component